MSEEKHVLWNNPYDLWLAASGALSSHSFLCLRVKEFDQKIPWGEGGFLDDVFDITEKTFLVRGFFWLNS